MHSTVFHCFFDFLIRSCNKTIENERKKGRKAIDRTVAVCYNLEN